MADGFILLGFIALAIAVVTAESGAAWASRSARASTPQR